MRSLQIYHRTTYRYRYPVALRPHRLLLRPRESHDLQLMSCELTISPKANVIWAQDVFGNAVATAAFQTLTDELSIESRIDLKLFAHPWPVYDIAGSAISYPFFYSDDEWTDLGALAIPQYADPAGRLRNWAGGFLYSTPTDTLSLLQDLCTGISGWISYQSRDAEGTQTPIQTLDRGWGACRDFAVLFVEAVRSLGFGARIVSGYLFNPRKGLAGYANSDSTHAWAEVYVPGAGWIAFDPTNRSMGDINLIPVAVARNIAQVIPVSGSFFGMTDAFCGMDINVSISE